MLWRTNINLCGILALIVDKFKQGDFDCVGNWAIYVVAYMVRNRIVRSLIKLIAEPRK